LKFEHLLQIYWTKGLFFGGNLFYTNKTFYEIFSYTPGLGKSSKLFLTKRLELSNSVSVNLTSLLEFKTMYHREITGLLNNYYSQVSSVNNVLWDLTRLNIIRLYLIKSYKGRCHAFGKPSRGQRTWSNGWTAFKYNNTLRKFISETKLKLNKDKVVEKINYKLTKKKYGVNKKKLKKVIVKRLVWF